MKTARQRSPKVLYDKSKFGSNKLSPRRSLFPPKTPQPGGLHPDALSCSSANPLPLVEPPPEPNQQEIDFKARVKSDMESLKMLIGIEIPLDSLISSELTDYELSLISSHREAKQRLASYNKTNQELASHIKAVSQQIDYEYQCRSQTVSRYDKAFERTKGKIKGVNEFYSKEIGQRHLILNEQNDELTKVINEKTESNKELARRELTTVFELKDKIINKTKQLQAISDIKEMEINKLENKYRRSLEESTFQYK